MAMPHIGQYVILKKGLKTGSKYDNIEFIEEMKFDKPMKIIDMVKSGKYCFEDNYILENGYEYTPKMIKKVNQYTKPVIDGMIKDIEVFKRKFQSYYDNLTSEEQDKKDCFTQMVFYGIGQISYNLDNLKEAENEKDKF
jgi:hypothetical protein